MNWNERTTFKDTYQFTSVASCLLQFTIEIYRIVDGKRIGYGVACHMQCGAATQTPDDGVDI